MKGVSYDPQPGGRRGNSPARWRVRVTYEGREFNLGRFETQAMAEQFLMNWMLVFPQLPERWLGSSGRDGRSPLPDGAPGATARSTDTCTGSAA